jgi:hypothetical protein
MDAPTHGRTEPPAPRTPEPLNRKKKKSGGTGIYPVPPDQL